MLIGPTRLGLKRTKSILAECILVWTARARSIRYTPMESGNLLILGGENHKTGQGVDTLTHYQALESFAKDVFDLSEYHYRWSAQDLVTLDKVPYIGPLTKNKEHILVATGL